MIEKLQGFLETDMAGKVIATLIALLVLYVLKFITSRLVCRRIEDDKRRYHTRRTVNYVYTFVVIIVIGSFWFQGIQSLSTFLGLASAGLAVAMHDTIANMAGFFFIEARKPFKVGDRIELEKFKGDVIDIRLFQFSIVEVGNWVDADQSTGRIIHVPNSMVLRAPLSNYHIGFEYIWNEIPVLITLKVTGKGPRSCCWGSAARMLNIFPKGHRLRSGRPHGNI